MSKTIYQDAAEHWPEDEAYGVAEYLQGLREVGEDPEYIAKDRQLRIERFQLVFEQWHDSAELFGRFLRALEHFEKENALLASNF
jgi:hypothetical protein